MTDLYLKAATQADMNAALIAAGLAYEKTKTPLIGYSYEGVIYDKSDLPHTMEWDEELGEDMPVYPDGIEKVYGDPVTHFLPAPFVNLDVIGPIVRIVGYDEEGDPITKEYPEWHVNVRCAGLTEEQEAELAFAMIVPPETPYRVWA